MYKTLLYLKEGIEMENEIILNTLRYNYSTDIDSIEFLRDGGCTTYLIYWKDNKYLLKIIKEAFMDTILESVKIIQYLQKHEFPVPKIIQTASGQSILNTSHNGMQCLFILYEYITGEEPDINVKAKDIGELIGKFHLLMKDYTGKLAFRGKPFFIDRYLDILKAKGYPLNKIEEYRTLGNQLWERIKDLPYGNCHGDLHRGNLLLTPDNKLYILDFDTTCYAPRMFDIMVMCDTTNYFDYNQNDYESTTEIYKQFLEGYSKFISLTDLEFNAFYDFIAIRHFQLQATIVELFGLDCIDEHFIDNQLNWLQNWCNHK